MKKEVIKGIIAVVAIVVLLSVVFSFAQSNQPAQQTKLAKPTPDTVLTTGGTIAEKTGKSGAVPSLSGNDLIQAVPSLANLANIKVHQFSNIDSSHMTPAHWYNLSKTVDIILSDPNVEGVVGKGV